jgi:hypothetical protein
MRNKHTR